MLTCPRRKKNWPTCLSLSFCSLPTNLLLPHLDAVAGMSRNGDWRFPFRWRHRRRRQRRQRRRKKAGNVEASKADPSFLSLPALDLPPAHLTLTNRTLAGLASGRLGRLARIQPHGALRAHVDQKDLDQRPTSYLKKETVPEELLIENWYWQDFEARLADPVIRVD